MKKIISLLIGVIGSGVGAVPAHMLQTSLQLAQSDQRMFVADAADTVRKEPKNPDKDKKQDPIPQLPPSVIPGAGNNGSSGGQNQGSSGGNNGGNTSSSGGNAGKCDDACQQLKRCANSDNCFDGKK